MERVLARRSKLESALKPIQFGDEGDLISGNKYLKGNHEPHRGKGWGAAHQADIGKSQGLA